MKNLNNSKIPYSIANLKPGDWIEIQFGTEYRIFYIVDNNPELKSISICSPYWPNDAMIKLDYKDYSFTKHPWWYLGRGRIRWIYKHMPNFINFKNIICPYSKP